MEKNFYKTENNVYRNWSRILHFEKNHILLNWFWPRVIFLVFHFLRFLCKNIIFRYFSTSLNFLNFRISCVTLVLNIKVSSLPIKECLSCPPPSLVSGGPYRTFMATGAPSGPKNEPKYAQTNQICLCSCSNRLEMGYLSLKSPRKCLRYIRLPWCLGVW